MAHGRRRLELPRQTYDEDRRRIVESLGERPPRTLAGIAVERVTDDGGFRLLLADGSWALLTLSEAEPLISLECEAASEDAVESRLAALADVVGLGGTGGG
jgi:phosphomannomutase